MYDYRFNPSRKELTLKTSGQFERCTIRIPVPEAYRLVEMTIDGRKVNPLADRVNKSLYITATVTGNNHQILVRYR
jgi:hypothetical protein